MYAMPQHQYPYSTPGAPAPRQYSAHGTSSAFSSSANPDEDWTKISDLAERRRIQNRIAQRNYRKKLKRRLEDLERRAGTSDDASSPTGSEKQSQSQSSARNTKKTSSSKSQKSSAAQKSAPQPQFTPPMNHEDEVIFGHPYDERGRTGSPAYNSYSYPSPDDAILPPYGSAQPYPTMTNGESYSNYITTPVPCTLPPMTHFHDAIKREPYPAEESVSSYMNYGFVHGIDVNAPHSYDHSNPHTPPLSHSYEHSANCSEAGYDYPTTPLSMPGSPGIGHRS